VPDWLAADLFAVLVDRPAWQRDGLCREPAYADVDFFPARGGDVGLAKQVCARCLVADECARYAVGFAGDEYGIFGGTTPRQRSRIRASLRPAREPIEVDAATLERRAKETARVRGWRERVKERARQRAESAA